MPQLDCLLKHEACLGHGTFGSIDKKKHAVDHFENTLDLAAEIGVTGGIDYIDLDALIER